MCDVRLERLTALLQEGHEHERLDYKASFLTGEPSAWIELAKDIGAMQVRGGHIVLGADGKGTPTGNLTLADARRLDEAVVRNKMKKWIPEPFELRVATHEIGGKLLAVISVAPNADGFCIFKADGFYDKKTVFRTGDVFVRHGSASERWQQPDIACIRANLREQAERRGAARIYEVALPRTMNVVGQAQALVTELGKASGRPYDPGRLTRAELEEICAAVAPHGPAPLIAAIDQNGDFVRATWWAYLQNLRNRSRQFTTAIQFLSGHLDAEHVALLAAVDQCPYFSQLDAFGGMHPSNSDFSWLSGPMWDYLQDIRFLEAYVQRKRLELAATPGVTA